MRIVNRKEFLTLPPNTLFTYYKPCYFGDTEIKMCTPGDWTNDFVTSKIVGNFGGASSREDIEIIEQMEKGISHPVDFESTCRDGFFDESQMFAIFEKQDIEALIERLKKCL